MLLPIKPLCGKSKARRDGTSIIFLQYCGPNNKRTLLNTEIAIPARYWNRRRLAISSDLPEEYGNARELNTSLDALLRKAEDIVQYGVKAGVEDLLGFAKKTFRPDFDITTLGTGELQLTINKATQSQDVFKQIEDYMEAKSKKVTPGMMNVYRNMRDLLKAYETFRGQKITFNCFNYDFYERFVEFLTYEYVLRRRKTIIKGLKQNSIGKTIKQLRNFLRDRIRRKIIAPIDLSDFKTLDEESDAIYLTEAEIGKLYQQDLSEFPHLEKYRDMLVLGCLTGLRFSDFSIIRPEDIRGDMLYKKQDKVDSWVVIPLRPEAYEILVRRFKGNIPPTSNPEFNRHIKTIGAIARITEVIKFSYKKGNKDIVVKKPKCEWITSHSCRRSFCTNEFLAGTPVELIMKISGHKSLRDFYRYIRISPEEAGNKIKEIWAKRAAGSGS